MRDPLNDSLLKCNCPDCGASLREQARYWEYEANEDLPHTITARCEACQTEHKFRLKPIGCYYECLRIEGASSSKDDSQKGGGSLTLCSIPSASVGR